MLKVYLGLTSKGLSLENDKEMNDSDDSNDFQETPFCPFARDSNFSPGELVEAGAAHITQPAHMNSAGCNVTSTKSVHVWSPDPVRPENTDSDYLPDLHIAPLQPQSSLHTTEDMCDAGILHLQTSQSSELDMQVIG